ncbi:MAG: diacylglycerol kinase family protein [Bacteroidetes bacterium]|nr:MAG: diacylglycerol kinase family protein [Bacteroidota bacterium]
MSWKARFNSFRFAFAGLVELFRSTPNARIHLFFAVAVVAAGFFLHISLLEWMLVVLCMAAVFAAEAFNSALENLTDLSSPQPHPLAGKAKDLAAAAVLLSALGAAVVGLLIFGPKICRLILDYFS